MSTQARTPSGSPNGGEFAATARAESTTTLDTPPDPMVDDLEALVGALSDRQKSMLFDRLAGQSVRGVDGHIRTVVSTINMMVLDSDYAPAVAIPSAFGGKEFTTKFDYSDHDGSGMLEFTFPDESSIVVYTNEASSTGPRDTTVAVLTAEGYELSLVAADSCVDDSDTPEGVDGWAANAQSRQEVGLWAAGALARAQLAESAVRYAAKNATHRHIEAIATEEPR